MMVFRNTICLLLGLLMAPPSLANQVNWSFDDAQTSWRVNAPPSLARPIGHVRTRHLQRRGDAAEHLRFQVTAEQTEIRLHHSLPAARAIDDLVLTLWVRANQAPVQVALQLVFPHETDPATGRVVTAEVRGTPYTQHGSWQQLTATTLEKQIRDQVFLLRTRLKRPELTARDCYVDRVSLIVTAAPDAFDIVIDDLEFGPIVAPRSGTQIVQASNTTSPGGGTPVEFRSHRLLVEGRPFLPRFLPHHGERAETLDAIGANVIWIPDYRNVTLLESLRSRRLWAMATPPRAGIDRDGRAASLLPFSRATAPVLFWYPGTDIPVSAKDELVAWTTQIRAADRTLKRPVMADVAGSEKVFSRQVDLLGISEKILNTERSAKDYHEALTRRRLRALPWSFIWTWVQCDPDPVLQETRRRNQQIPMVVEPEQIRMQVYASLSAGCRGIGYWKRNSLEEATSREAMLVISQLNLELGLIEPFVASGSNDGSVEFKVFGTSTPVVTRSQFGPAASIRRGSRQELLIRAKLHENLERNRKPTRLEASVIRHDHGILLLPQWFDPVAQFVPGPMQASKAELTVPGVPASASAWEITPTRIRSLDRQPVAGGLKITIPEFNQTSAILVTSDRKLIAEMQGKIARTAGASAYLEVELQTAKLNRVRLTEQELRNLGVAQSLALEQLTYAGSQLQSARAALTRREYDQARLLARHAGAVVRTVQRASWNDAVRTLPSPVASLHTLCYQTLPDYWSLIKRLGTSVAPTATNALRSGDFEDVETMMVEGWDHHQNTGDADSDVAVRADLYPTTLRNTAPDGTAIPNKLCLRLEALPKPRTTGPFHFDRSPVEVHTPEVTARAGQVLHISGWVRILTPPGGQADPVLIYDSLGGEPAAFRFQRAGGWQRFSMLRQVTETGPVRLTFALTGIGIAQFDNIQIIPQNVDTTASSANPDRLIGVAE